MNCFKCDKSITADEIALHKKLFSKTSTEFMCISCAAEYFEVTRELLEEKIKQYKDIGCSLFRY